MCAPLDQAGRGSYIAHVSSVSRLGQAAGQLHRSRSAVNVIFARLALDAQLEARSAVLGQRGRGAGCCAAGAGRSALSRFSLLVQQPVQPVREHVALRPLSHRFSCPRRPQRCPRRTPRPRKARSAGPSLLLQNGWPWRNPLSHSTA